MARRPIQAKKLARLRKQVNRRPLPAFIDLTIWLQDRGYAQTGGAARRLMTDGKVRVGSHAVGRRKEFIRTKDENLREEWVAAPLIHAELRNDLSVQA